MGTPQYPIDLIAIRDAKGKMASTVIKWWNVNYILPPEDLLEPPMEEATMVAEEPEVEEMSAEQQALIDKANDIFARLEAEKAADEAVKQAEIDAALAAQNDANYNASTGSYSGTYGTGPIDDSTRDLAASILQERDDAMADLLNGITVSF